MIRITGGQYKGQVLHCPKGKAVRPTTSFVRESLFNIIGSDLVGATFLDIFAGCGIVGIEALSRGAHTIHAIEKNSTHCRLLEQNRGHLKINPEVYQIYCQDALNWLSRSSAQNLFPNHQFDFIFMDPPYKEEKLAQSVILNCLESQILRPGGLIIWESDIKTDTADITGAAFMQQRTYGTSKLSFFTYPDSSETR